jgi:hypothetical protein
MACSGCEKSVLISARLQSCRNYNKMKAELYRQQKNSSEMARKQFSRWHEASGHDFSRAERATKPCWALAPGGRFFALLIWEQAFFRSLFSPDCRKSSEITVGFIAFSRML